MQHFEGSVSAQPADGDGLLPNTDRLRTMVAPTSLDIAGIDACGMRIVTLVGDTRWCASRIASATASAARPSADGGAPANATANDGNKQELLHDLRLPP
jgi:hypothetical protein